MGRFKQSFWSPQNHRIVLSLKKDFMVPSKQSFCHRGTAPDLLESPNLVAVPVQCEKYIGEASECDDFNDVTLAYEDASQVRFTRSSLHHPVNNKYKSKTQKVKVNMNRYCLK